MDRKMTNEREKVIDKIRHLMAKTVENGCTEEEALSALTKARAIMDVHEVSDEELSLTKEEKAIPRTDGSDDPHSIKFNLIYGISTFCGCKAWRDPDHGIVFCGLRSDTDFATYLLDTLTAFVRAQTIEHLMSTIAEGRE